MSLYSLKTPDASPGATSPWSTVLTLSEAGDKLARLAALYDRRPETLVSGTLAIPSTLDGPVQMAVFEELVLNGAVLTVTNPCRGLFVVCKRLTVTGAASTITMSEKGCVNADWENYDLTIPTLLSLASSHVPRAQVMDLLRKNGWYAGDPQLWKGLAGLVTGSLTQSAYKLIDKAGLGFGGAQGNSGVGQGTTYCRPGNSGGAGTGGPGGGSAGCGDVNDTYTTLYHKEGGYGRSWRGGFPGNGGNGTTYLLSGDILRVGLPGGVLIVAVTDALDVGPGLTLSANATRGTEPHGYHIGGPGGGAVRLLTGGTVTGSPTLQANGAVASCTCDSPLTGGAGVALQHTFTAWGL